jgi:hypothetical protein
MLNINEVRNGRIYSVVFHGPVNMNKGGRMGVPVNPLIDSEVIKRDVIKIQACSRDSYARRMRKLNPDWQPDTSKPSGYAPTENPCVDANLASGDFALRGWACGRVKHQVYVNGQPATPDQLELIAAYQPGGKWFADSKPKKDVTFMRLPLAKIEHEGWLDADDEN